MTCIIGYVDEKKNIWMGGDSIAAGACSKSQVTQPKVFKKGKMIFGYTSSFRMGQLIEHVLNIPKHPKGMSDYKYLITKFVPSVIKVMESCKYASIKNNEIQGGFFLIGYNQHIYKMQADFSITESLEKYHSVGCGDELALGSIYTLKELNKILKYNEDFEIHPDVMINIALNAASTYSTVSPPFHIIKLAYNSGRNT